MIPTLNNLNEQQDPLANAVPSNLSKSSKRSSDSKTYNNLSGIIRDSGGASNGTPGFMDEDELAK